MSTKSLTDLDLIELAVRAAGHVHPLCYEANPESGEPHAYASTAKGIYFRPFSNPGDALSLAATLVKLNPGMVLCLSIGIDRAGCEFNFVDGPGVLDNTCRAIVIAAAELQLRRNAMGGA